MSEKPKTKKSSLRHTRAIQRDRTKRRNTAAPDEATAERLMEIVHPLTLNQVAHFSDLGLRARVLNLPVMIAFGRSPIWRQLGSVTEAVRTLNREGLLPVNKRKVSQQAVEQRCSRLPAALFERVVQEAPPLMAVRWAARTRPSPPALQWVRNHFPSVLTVDGSTLDALLRKTGLLRDGEGPVLTGRMAGLLDGITRLPRQVWYEQAPNAHDQRFWDKAPASLERGVLLLFDPGFLTFARFDQLTDAGVFLLTRKEERIAVRPRQALRTTDTRRDQAVRLRSSKARPCAHPVRLAAWRHQGVWYRSLTNVPDPQPPPAEYVVALDGRRWRCEDCFAVMKRLLGLACFWTGSINGVHLQMRATWIVYAVLVDLTDAVGEALNRPFHALSMEMVYRGLYHFTVAYHRGKADDPITCLAADAEGLGIIKRRRKHRGGAPELLYLTIPSPP